MSFISHIDILCNMSLHSCSCSIFNREKVICLSITDLYSNQIISLKVNMSRPFIQKSFRLANRNQFYVLVIVCSLSQLKIDIKAQVSFISSAQPALLHVNEASDPRCCSHGFIWCSVSLTSTGVISWTEDTQSNQGLRCKAVFWSLQIGSTCALVLEGEEEGLMRQFDAPSAAFLGLWHWNWGMKLSLQFAFKARDLLACHHVRWEGERKSERLVCCHWDRRLWSAQRQTTARTRCSKPSNSSALRRET